MRHFQLWIRPLVAAMGLFVIATSGCNCGEGTNGNNSNDNTNSSTGDTTPPTTSATPSGGDFGEPVRVELSCDDGDGSGCDATYFTLDGSVPTSASEAYDAPILIAVNTTLTFFSTDIAGNEEGPKTETYTLSDSTPPEVVETDPSDGATGVDPFASVTVRFSEPIEPSTLTGETFRVGALPGTVEYDVESDSATFTPRLPMPANATLDARITTDVSDLGGNPVAEDFVWSFTTGEPDQQALTSSQPGATQSRPTVVFDDDQAGLAVWTSDARPGRQLLYSYRDSLNGDWSAERTLTVDFENQPSVAAAGSGFAAAWAAPTPEGGRSVQVRLFADGAWGEVTTLASLPDDAIHSARVVSNGTGYAVSWRAQEAAAHNYAAVFEDGTWSPPRLLDNNGPSGNLVGGVSASNGDGYAVAWRQYDPTLDTWDVYVSVYELGTWYREGVDDPASNGFAYDPQLATDGAGYAVAYRHAVSTGMGAFVAIYSGGSWGVTTQISPVIPGGFGADAPVVAGDRTGGYVAAWSQLVDPAFSRRLYAASHSASGWAPATTLQDPGDTELFSIAPIVATSGHFAVTWLHGPSGARRAYAATYRAGAGGGWSLVTNLSSGSTSVNFHQAAAARGEDEFVAVWTQGIDWDLWASHYADTDGWASAVPLGQTSTQSVALTHDGDDFHVAFARDLERHSDIALLREQQGDWSEPMTLVQETHVSSCEVGAFAVGPEGDVVAVWSELQGPVSVLLASINEGRTWSEPFELGTAWLFQNVQAVGGPGGFGVAAEAIDGISARGVLGAVYEGGAWNVEELDPDAGSTSTGLTVVSSDVGYAVAWEHHDAQLDVWAATFDGQWGVPQVISDETAGYATAVTAVGLAGELLVAYQQGNDLIAASWRGTDWSRSVVTTDASSLAVGRVTRAAARDDSVMLVWVESTGVIDQYLAYAAVREADVWSQTDLLTDAGVIEAEGVRATAGADGFGVTVMKDEQLFASIYADGAWTAERLDNGVTPPLLPSITPTATGYGVVWAQEGANPGDADVWFRSYDGVAWSAAAQLNSGVGEVPSVNLAVADDRIVAVWTEEPADGPAGVFTSSFRDTWTAPRRLDDGVAPGAGWPSVFHRGGGVIGAAWPDRVTAVDPAARVIVYLPSL